MRACPRGAGGGERSLPFRAALRGLFGLGTAVLLPAAQAQELRVYLNTDDCINCTAALSLIRSLDTAIAVTIHADAAKKRFIPEALERFGIAGDPRIPVEYIPTADLLAVASPASQCVFRAKGRAEERFPLKEIGLHLRDMNVYASDFGHRRYLPFADSLVLSDRCSFFSGAGQLVITDYILGKAYRIDLRSERSVRVERLLVPDTFTRDYMKAIGLSLARYDSLAALLSASGGREPVVRSASFRGDTLQAYVVVPYPGVSPEDSTYMMRTSYPAFVLWVDGRIVGWRRCDYSMPDSLGLYYQDPAYGFHLSDDALVTPVRELPRTSASPWILGEYGCTDRSVRFSRMLDVHLPKLVRKEGMKEAGYRIHAHGDLFILSCYPYFFDVSQGKGYDLGHALSGGRKHFFFEQEQLRYWTQDARWMDDGTLILLSYRHKAQELTLTWVDVGSGTLLRSLPLPLDDVIVSSLRLLDDGRVIGVAKDLQGLVVLEGAPVAPPSHISSSPPNNRPASSVRTVAK